ncbi:hypothetical protein quinque_012216 [Culex quinquefasciatus]
MQLGIVADTKVLCRVCMVPVVEHPANLYDDASPFGLPSLHDMLRTICAPVFAKPEAEAIVPNMPTIVCLVCRNAIVAAYNLHQQCIETDRRLGELVALMWELHGPDSDEIGEVSEDPPKSSIKEASAGEEIPLLNTELVDVIKVEALDLMDENQSNNEEEVNEVRDLQCTNCGISFSSNRAYRDHKQEGNCERQETFPCSVFYPCTICEKKFDTLTRMRYHRRNHIQRINCSKCGQTFRNKACLRMHLKREGSCLVKPKDPLAETYTEMTEGCDNQCTVCGATFLSSRKLEAHTQEGNCHRRPVYPCTICGKSFDRLSRMRYHRRNHRQRVSCSECGLLFRNKASLRMHIKRGSCPNMLENSPLSGDALDTIKVEEPEIMK